MLTILQQRKLTIIENYYLEFLTRLKRKYSTSVIDYFKIKNTFLNEKEINEVKSQRTDFI